MSLLADIAIKHLLARKRQSVVSLLGIVLGVAFFLAIASLMQGSEKDFIKRLVDNSPHITIHDEFRNPRSQPIAQLYPNAAIELPRVKPLTENRGIRGFEQVLEHLRLMPGVSASPILAGQALVNYAGRDLAITANGVHASELNTVSTLHEYMLHGAIEDLIANPDGVIIGAELARKLSLNMGDNVTLSSATGQVRVFKVLGIFRTGRADYDQTQAFASIKRIQALLNRANRANSIIIKLENPHIAQTEAKKLEEEYGYKAVSWQEVSEDILSTLVIRNIIMYTVVSAVLVVAAFGIYNVISTVVMEKQKDISILKSMGFRAQEVKTIFVIQGILLGIAGCAAGIPLGCGLMLALMQVRFKPPGGTELIQMPLDWSWPQFAIAIAFAMSASIVAALLPARKAAHVQPV
ncbi:MAG: ABC transporter permease, partial [Rickettsiales bacterium]|nr:ABC transporter permease [Rickettsiales bacterium]